MEFDTRRRRAVLTVSIEGARQQSWSRHPAWLAMKRQAVRLHGQRRLMHRCGVVRQYASKAEKTGDDRRRKWKKHRQNRLDGAFDESSMLRAGRPRAGGGVQFQQRYGVQACGRRCRGEPERFFPKCRIIDHLTLILCCCRHIAAIIMVAVIEVAFENMQFNKLYRAERRRQRDEGA